MTTATWTQPDVWHAPVSGSGARNGNGAALQVDNSPADCSWFSLAQQQFDAICGLTQNWDSNGAPPPDPRIVRAGERLLACLSQAAIFSKPHINPTPDEGVQFDWESATRYFELVVASPDSAEYLFQDHERGIEEIGELEIGGSLDDVVAYIRRVESTAS